MQFYTHQAILLGASLAALPLIAALPTSDQSSSNDDVASGSEQPVVTRNVETTFLVKRDPLLKAIAKKIGQFENVKDATKAAANGGVPPSPGSGDAAGGLGGPGGPGGPGGALDAGGAGDAGDAGGMPPMPPQ